MKRIKAGCIYQTLIFRQKDDCGLSIEEQLICNREEVECYKDGLIKNKTRHIITDVSENRDGSITVCVRKEVNDHTDIAEYFEAEIG